MSLIKQVTRFNPTVSGPLHVGHVYLALVNEAEAHASGGKFIVRFEDDQAEWVWRTPRDEMNDIMQGVKDDFAWLGIQVDEYLAQSEMGKEFDGALNALDDGGYLPVQGRFAFDQQPELTYSDVVPYPYAPYLTRDRVIFDYLSLVNLLIRGEDLVTEYSLYAYFCEVFGIQRPRMVYLPRLLMANGDDLLLGPVSKTAGNCKVKTYRDQGVTPEQLLERLRQACLIDPAGPWLLKNVKRAPLWTC